MKFSESRLSQKYSDKEIIQKVEEEYQIGYTSVIVKRQKFRLQDVLINHVSDTAANPYTRIDLKTLTKFLETQIALFFTDEIDINFTAAVLGGQEKAGRLNRAAKFDHRIMGKKYLDYETQMNRILRGVGIQAKLGWDDVKKVPIFQSMDTRSWIPDPLGWHDPKEFRFHGFEATSSKGALSEEQGYDMEVVMNAHYDESPESRLSRVTAQIFQGIMPSGYTTSTTHNSDNQQIDLYHHYTRIDGDMYMITLCNTRKEICRIEQIDPVYKDEKKDKRLIPFPVALYYFFPIKYDPFGINMIDMAESEHRYLNELMNLMYIREKDAALGPDILVEANSVKNIADLEQPSQTRRFIPANDVEHAIREIPVSSAPESNTSFLQLLEQKAMESVSLNATDMGNHQGGEITLGQAQQIQASSNLKSMFKNTLNNEGEEQFWKLWHRAYKEHLSSSAKKNVIVEQYLGSFVQEMKKSDFIFDEDPEIEIRSMNTERAENDIARANLVPQLMAMLQDPTTLPFTRTILQRKILELNGVDHDEAMLLTGTSATELDALSKRVLLDHDNMLGAKVEDVLNDEHETYIAVFQQGVKTNANFYAIKARQQAIMEQKKLQQQQQMAQQQAMAEAPQGEGGVGGATKNPYNNPSLNAATSSAMNQAAVMNNTPKNVVTRAQARP